MKEGITMEAIRTINSITTENGGYVTTLKIDDHNILVYQPHDEMHSDVINYGYSAPLLLVFPEEICLPEEAAGYADTTGLAAIAAENGGSVVFVNPKTKWEEEENGLYEKVIAKTKIKQWGFSHGVLYDDKVARSPFEAKMMEDPNFDHEPEYFIFGSPVAAYVYAKGKAADYFARYYLREIEGKSSMGDLGTADITMSAVTLANLSIVPEVECEDISIVSVNNSPEVNKALQASANRVALCDKLEVISQYDEYIGDYKRWAGKIRKSVNFRKEGIIMKPERMMVDTSADNKQFTDPKHEAAYVLFYGKDLPVNDKENPVPLVLCFHGGGDTAIATAIIGEWPQIAKENGFILCAVEMHLGITATETMQIVKELEKQFAIDTGRLYATGFSMGGIKSWDMYQEYPECFAALAPMDATVDVGENTQFSKSAKVNEEIMVPVFYNAGELSPLAEAPFQDQKCINRIAYTFKINKVVKPYDISLENKDEWEDKIYGVKGDFNEEYHDPDYPDSITTVRSYKSEDGRIYTRLCSISNHQHEIRPFTCRLAYEFLKQFARRDGKIVQE